MAYGARYGLKGIVVGDHEKQSSRSKSYLVALLLSRSPGIAGTQCSPGIAGTHQIYVLHLHAGGVGRLAFHVVERAVGGAVDGHLVARAAAHARAEEETDEPRGKAAVRHLDHHAAGGSAGGIRDLIGLGDDDALHGRLLHDVRSF